MAQIEGMALRDLFEESVRQDNAMNRPPLVLPSALSTLVNQPRWVVWRWVTGQNGKPTKPPFQGCAPGMYASSTDPRTWCTLERAMQAYTAGQADGVGFALHGSGIGAFDIDHSRNASSGLLHPWAAALVERCGSYTEVTPSGTGIRIIGTASGSALHRKLAVPGAGDVSCEIYRDAERYITVSGAQIGNADTLASLDAHIDVVMAKLAGKAKSGHDLDSLIRDGCGDDFNGDRSRAVWYVVCQLLKQGRSADDIVALLLDQANGISAHVYDQRDPEAYARRQVENAQRETAAEVKDDLEIRRLAGLGAVQYERERKDAAERLGLRAAILDRLVQAERPSDSNGKQGRAVAFADPEPWESPVDGAELLDAIAEAVSRYVVLSEHSRDVAALWVTHTHLLDCFSISPRLAISSPVMRCGKSTLIDVLARLVLRPLPTENVTASAVFRVVEAYRPTLLVDEADTFVRENDELRGIINSGYRRNGSVLRIVGEDHEARAFSTYSACAIALIGTLPDTLHDRSVPISLKRRLAKEPITPFRHDQVGHLDVLAKQAARWARDYAAAVSAAEPAMPEGVFNREADNLHTLLAIAQVAGGHWPQRARKAVLASRGVADDDSLIAALLSDIRQVFADRADPHGKLPSSKLVDELAALEGRPWAEYRDGKPLSQNQLARLLRPLGIAPEVARVGKKTPRTYQLHVFADAFERYLPPEGLHNRNTETNAEKPGTSGAFQSATQDHDVALAECEKSSNDGSCCGVAVAEGVFLTCEHCGGPETPEQPVREYLVGGDRCFLHPQCEQEWLEQAPP